MRKFLRRALAAVGIAYCCANPLGAAYAAAASASGPARNVAVGQYEDVLLALLYPSIQNAVDAYYKPYFRHLPAVAPYMNHVVSVEKPAGYRVTVQVSPYFGPHLEVGIDHITLAFDAIGNDVRVVRFEHIKSYELPARYRDEIISSWPPA